MSAKTIKSALGLLQDDPDRSGAWKELRGLVGGASDAGDMQADELVGLLDAARRQHEARREGDAVAKLLDVELQVVKGTPREASVVAELAQVLDEDLLDEEGARAAYSRLGELRPDDRRPFEAIERSEAKRARWRELVDRFVQEAQGGGDGAFRGSLLVSAAEVTYRYGREGQARLAPPQVEQIMALLGEALGLDAKNRRAEMLLERVLRQEGRWDDLARAIENYAVLAPKEERLASWVRLARLFARKLQSPERAAAAYERALDLAPGHPEASSFLAELFHANKMWDHLVALYEGQLLRGALKTREEELGAVLQVAMVHWRMRGAPEAAEPFFERLRRLEPAHPGMLSFFREWCASRGETDRLATVLAEAQRAVPDGAERAAIVAEIANLAEEGANPQKAIEQWRSVLRQDPQSVIARDALKRLYRQNGSYNALTDLLRQELEKLPADDAPGRVPLLREIAGIYREHAKSDASLVTVLTQILALYPDDLATVRDLARVYQSLQRWRDLLTTQARQAELEPDLSVGADLWRAIARRWLDQFSNVQNAVEAYEKLHAVDPRDQEAIDRLRELYGKRRAYRPLYDLLAGQARAMPPGPERRALWTEMAKLAAERLDMGTQAVGLYKMVLDEDPSSSSALDALEKQAERDKDFSTVAEVLERRATLAAGDAAQLIVLQKLGSIYSDRLHDQAKAMSAWRRVLTVQAGHAKALRVLRDNYLSVGDYDGLTELYAQNGDWEGLAEVLSGAADKVIDPDVKVDLSFRCAAIYVDRLKAPDRAFRSYERVLSARPDDARAATALVPLYESDEKWGRLPGLYETLLRHTDDPEEKLALLERLVQVCGHQLQDRVSAFAWGRKAYELAPGREGGLVGFEAIARLSGQWSGFVEALSARLASLEPATEGTRGGKKKKKREKDKDSVDSVRRGEVRQLRAKLAEVYARELGRIDEAVATYRALVEEDEGDDVAVQTLDLILREADREDDLRWLFDVRVERANTALKLDLLAEWAMLEEEAFAAPERAVDLYRRMLRLVPQHGGALRALARLLRSLGDAQGAVDVIAIDRDQRQGADRAAREIELGKLFADPLRRYADALAACERALDLIPNDPRAIEVVEQLLLLPETRARAAAILEHAYADLGDARRQTQVLEVLVATAASHADRLALYMRMADVHERNLDDAGAAFDVLVRAAGEFPTELQLWDRLDELSSKAGRAPALVDAIVSVVAPEGPTGLPERVEMDLASRAALLFDEKLGDPLRARPYLERMLARRPDDESAFRRLKQILTAGEHWSELAGLYEKVVAATPEALRRAELLAEVALVAEETTGEKTQAISYYERILELDPDHDQAIRALGALYGSEGQWDRLARLLERRLPTVVGEDRLDMQRALGTLLFAKLGDAAGALGYLEHVLHEQPASLDARLLVEKILDVGPLRSRAARVLEAVYTERDDVADLVRILEIHLEFAQGGDERRNILRRIAQLRDERLRDDAGAFETFARLLPLDPDNARARQRTIEIAQRLGAFDRAAGVLTATAASATAPLPRAEILMDLARICEGQLADVPRADAVYREVLQLAPTDPAIALPTCRALERIYSATGANRQLAEVLGLEVTLEDDPDARRELRGRLGELCEAVLDDPLAAIASWRARIEEDPNDAQALSALDRLYERTQRWRELVDVLRTRERLADDGQVRRALLVRIATTLADKLADVKEATLAYRTVVDDFGADRPSLAGLAVLYELADRWQDLADTLEADLELADDAPGKLVILARLGDVKQRHLGDVGGAIEAYRQALVLQPSHGGCRAALEAMLDEAAARREAASILRPLYEIDGQHQKLLKVLEIEAGYGDVASDRLAVIAQAADVAEGPLGDSMLAMSYAARGLKEAAAEPSLPRWIERAERLATATGRHDDLVALLRSIVDDILDGDLQLGVTIQIAELARSRLSDSPLAMRYYARALELRSDDRRALGALESLYEEVGDYPALLDVIKRRADGAETEGERRQLLFKQARLCDERLADARAAIGVYEQIVELGLDREAVSALERLYTNAQRWDDLVALYERQIAAPSTPRERKAALYHALGDVFETRTHEIERAFEQYGAALAVDPLHAPTVASLEVLMSRRDHAARAAEMLEPVYLARLDGRRVLSTLEARLGVSQDPDERRHLLRRLAKMHEEQEENYDAALETTAKLLSEDPADESTWGELERLARVANAERRLASIYSAELAKIVSDEPVTARLARRTGELYEAQGDADGALSFYRRAHAFDPEAKDGTFEAIDRLLRTSGMHTDRVRLYREALDYMRDPQERLGAMHIIARLEEVEIGDDAAAIETFRAALDADDGDLRSLDALSRLYVRTERWRDLADLTRKRAEQSALSEDESRFRLDLAKLLAERLGEPAAAIDELQTVIELTPPAYGGVGAQAVQMLEQMLRAGERKSRVIEILRPIYERADDWLRLIAINDERLGLAANDGERVAILRESATLWEGRGGDLTKAFDAMRRAWTIDPEDGDARDELERLAHATQRWDDLGDAYELAVSKTGGVIKRDLLGAIARLHDEKRDDPRRAMGAWGRVFALDETELAPLEEMDALATLLSDWTTLVQVLVKKADLLPDDASRASTWRRVGEAKRDMLDDVGGAIEAYERALDLAPASAVTIDDLIALYEQGVNVSRLVDLYRRRVDLCAPDEDGLKFRLLVDAAGRLESDPASSRDAIECLVHALAVRPGDAEVLRRLDDLYTRHQMWSELLDNLELEVKATDDEGLRATLRKRIAALYAIEIHDPRAALDAYREVLSAGYDAEASAAIRAIGEAHDDLRAEAANALEPVLRAAGRHVELAAVLELRLRAQDDPAARGRTLRALAGIAEGALGDIDQAQSALLRALAEEPNDASLHGQLARLADRAGVPGYSRYADALQERAAAVFDAHVAADLFVRLGEVSEYKLDDPSRAARAYLAAVERTGDEPTVLAPLDRLFARLGSMRALADILERRILVESQPSMQADLLHRLAMLQIHEFDDAARGLATLRHAIERVPSHASSREALEGLLDNGALFDEAFDALELVHRTLGQREELARLYGRRVSRAQTTVDRTRARLNLARVLEDTVGDRARAQRVVEDAIAEDAADAEALSEVERLAAVSGTWQEAAAALARALGGGSPTPAARAGVQPSGILFDLPTSTQADLWVRLAGWHASKLRDPRGAEAAYEKALALDPDNLEVLRALEEIRRAPGRERELVVTLRARARLETHSLVKRELLQEAKGLAETAVGDGALVEATLRDMIAEDDGDLWALAEMTKRRDAAGDHADTVQLMLRRADLSDGAEALALKHHAARVLVDRLNDFGRAIPLYEEILDADPTDAVAATALRKLYVEAGRYRELVRLLSRLIDVATSQSDRVELRLELAHVYEEKFKSTEDAIEALRAVLDEDRTHAGAVVTLSRLYEEGGRDAELADLLRTQIDAARDRADLGTQLSLLVRLGEVQERRLDDVTAAHQTYEEVLEREPTHRAALEAVARMSERRADWERAAATLATLVDMSHEASGVPWALRLAEAREKLGDANGAEEALQRGLELEPNNAGLRAMLRVRWEKAEKWAELAALLVGDADILAAKSADGKTIDQVKLLRAAAEIHVVRRNRPEDAIAVLERAAQLVPHDRDLLLALCDAYNGAQRGREAAIVLEKVIASFGNRRTKELALYHHRLGRALAQLGDRDVALAQLDMAFKIDPGSVTVLRDLGVLAYETNDLDRAQKTFRALLLQRLDHNAGISKGEVFYYLGEISAKQGDKAKAVQMLERAIENDPALERARTKLMELKG